MNSPPQRRSFNASMDAWYAAHPDIPRVRLDETSSVHCQKFDNAAGAAAETTGTHCQIFDNDTTPNSENGGTNSLNDQEIGVVARENDEVVKNLFEDVKKTFGQNLINSNVKFSEPVDKSMVSSEKNQVAEGTYERRWIDFSGSV